ncbi:hypothetical protein EB796_020827 [Bugula neritina]|uniref:Uncharacterized protein n=1 Tax=Bugula neritina TaxID=10212 RepID=A0A7J7J412_BUGNE|nr:hypothetical protein EB796_020827 [Bugula neritina]
MLLSKQVLVIGKFGTFTEENRTTNASNIFQPQCECEYKFTKVDLHNERCLGVVNLIWENIVIRELSITNLSHIQTTGLTITSQLNGMFWIITTEKLFFI